MRPPKAIVAVADEGRAPFKDFIDHMRRWLLFLDAPAHTRLRKFMNKGFAPLTVERLRPRVVGSTLARLEGQVAIAALLQRFPRMRLLDSAPDWATNFAFRELRSLRVAV